MNLAAFAAAYALFHASHGIGDYWLQTDWQAQNKAKNPLALWSHVATYTLTFLPALLFLASQISLSPLKILGALLAIGIPHGLMDTRKLINWFCAKTKGWSPSDQPGPFLQSLRLFVTIEMDQKFHYVSLALVAIWLAS